MRVGDIERQVVEDNGQKAEMWSLSPKKHKTAKKNKGRVIAFGTREQAVLAPYLASKSAEDFVFRPADAVTERKQSARARRKYSLHKLSEIENVRRIPSASAIRFLILMLLAMLYETLSPMQTKHCLRVNGFQNGRCTACEASMFPNTWKNTEKRRRR